ncbi:hypothetical protein [Hugenholtzia roseola]|uniref:hypothetical protein n=1 Tax=Hugenholtzia roseola TaxID=1002 RepID=UPI000415D046|nr:hypothetical protein [Hugenholtzia roseola]
MQVKPFFLFCMMLTLPTLFLKAQSKVGENSPIKAEAPLIFLYKGYDQNGEPNLIKTLVWKNLIEERNTFKLIFEVSAAAVGKAGKYLGVAVGKDGNYFESDNRFEAKGYEISLDLNPQNLSLKVVEQDCKLYHDAGIDFSATYFPLLTTSYKVGEYDYSYRMFEENMIDDFIFIPLDEFRTFPVRAYSRFSLGEKIEDLRIVKATLYWVRGDDYLTSKVIYSEQELKQTLQDWDLQIEDTVNIWVHHLQGDFAGSQATFYTNQEILRFVME